jgi:hypothetical protein
MDNSLFKINPEQKHSLYAYNYFTLFGQHDDFDDEGNPTTNDEKKGFAYTRLNTNDKTEQYFLKVGLYGKIFNPIGLYSEGRENKFMSKIGKNEYNFTKVNKKVFDMYVNFLRTKNLAWLNNAERELS